MQNDTISGGGIFSIICGVMLALACSLLSAVIFANVLRATAIPEKLVYPINQGIKVLSITIGALLFVRGEKGWLKGGTIGVLFTALSYLAFSAIGGDFSLSWLIFAELLLAFFAGACSGIIAVNVRR